MNKDLKKLAKILRLLDVYAKIEEKGTENEFLCDAWCPDIVEEWVKRIEHDKNNDVDYVIDTYMFGVIENDRERKSSDFHVSFCYRGQ